ncbi:YcnI family protein [Streptomyces sp. NPDC056105]|uniref:YcnI family copper-binding membrane protein n=1 Tax=Streptomyces sp. NPDC056105 TaxID=3345714 RepID=UPI0035D95005
MTRPPLNRSSRPAHRAAAVLGTAAGALFLLAGPASAHVRVFSDGAVEGSPATLRFRVPSEKADAATVRVGVTFPKGVTPTDVPPASGWTRKEMPSPEGGATRIMWTATAGHELKPDEHRYFDVRVGPLPKEASAAFDVTQTYSDGSVVNWNERQTGTEEPDFPAPVLVLDAAAAKAERARQESAAQPRPAGVAAPPPAAATQDEGSGVVSWLPWTVAGAAVLGAGTVVVVRRRTTPDRAGPTQR